MVRTVYFPTFFVDFYGKCKQIYIYIPHMDPMEMACLEMFRNGTFADCPTLGVWLAAPAITSRDTVHKSVGFLSVGIETFDKLGWCFSILFFIFTSKIGEDEPNLTSIFFQMGWFNHQLVKFWSTGTGFWLSMLIHSMKVWCKSENVVWSWKLKTWSNFWLAPLPYHFSQRTEKQIE